MFVLTVLHDVVRVAADKFDRELLEVLAEELDKKYANKVIVDTGLCICVHDFLTVEDAMLYPADGGAHHPVVFRCLVFRPFIGEVAVGTITGANKDGIKVSLDFFDDVFVPSYLLPQPAEYDSRAKLWVWKYEGSEEGGIFSMHEQVRFRVESISFTQVETTAEGQRAITATTAAEAAPAANAFTGADMRGSNSSSATVPPIAPLVKQRSTSVDLSADATVVPAVMQITASVNDHGLGLVCWNWE
jgi:DNA-directed RNA polymerase III subunit RPC8